MPDKDAARVWTFALVLALVALGIAWESAIAPIGRGTLAIKVVPLVLLLPGLWRGTLRVFKWTSLVVWLYVGEGLVRATTEGGASAWLAAVEVALALGAFVALSFFIRAGRPATAAGDGAP